MTVYRDLHNHVPDLEYLSPFYYRMIIAVTSCHSDTYAIHKVISPALRPNWHTSCVYPKADKDT